MHLRHIAPLTLSLFGLLATSAAAGPSHGDEARARLRAELEDAGLHNPTLVDAALNMAAQSRSTLLYVVRGNDARRNREETGAPVVSVQGVTAEPVDSGVFDGVGHEKLSFARAWMVVDPVNDTGLVLASWRDDNGFWTYSRTVMLPPPHPTGLRLGGDATQIVPVTDAVQTHGYQHGNTTVAGGPLMPTVFQHVSCYGPTQVTLNGAPFLNPFSGATAPDWFGAVKVSDGVRDDLDGTVRNTSGGIFSPMTPADSATDPDDLELQLVFHDDALPPGSTVGNFPPRHRFFYWITFEEVSMRIVHL